MIKRFKTRFIIITMVLVGIVSLVAFAAIGVMNYRDIKSQVDGALSHEVEESFFGMDDLPDLGKGGNGHPGDNRGFAGNRIPTYSVTVYYGDSEHIIVNSSSTAQMDSSIAQQAVSEVLSSQNDQGTLAAYGLYYKVGKNLTGYRIAFASTDTVTEQVGQNALMLLGFWLVLMLAIFFITLFLSRYVARPVEKAWEEQQRFIADASHELKTPLTIIMADATILAEDPQKTVGEQSAWIEGISAEASRMQQLTEDMLTLAQADAGIDLSQIMSEVDFSSLVEMQTLQFDAVAFERGLSIEEDVESGLKVLGDGLRLENMVKTLLENACKYSEKPGVVNVGLHRQKNNAVLTVHNPGDPIPAEDLEHLFDRFYRSDKSRVREGETASFGLGLSIAKSTAEMHGGAISAVSNAQGTTFTVAIPLAAR